MKITDVIIRLEASSGEDLLTIELHRTNRVWQVINMDGSTRGLYPYEVKLANNIQEDIIAKFNASDARNL